MLLYCVWCWFCLICSGWHFTVVGWGVKYKVVVHAACASGCWRDGHIYFSCRTVSPCVHSMLHLFLCLVVILRSFPLWNFIIIFIIAL
jgi:hypothetical protein